MAQNNLSDEQYNDLIRDAMSWRMNGPDLLAALTGVIDSLETADKEWQIAAIERAQAAIRKATGGAE